MSASITLALLTCSSAALVGCHSKPPPPPVLSIGANEPMRMSQATEDGPYTILDAQKKPQGTFELKTGDALGFRHEGDHVIAVAGASEKVLASGAYTFVRGR